MTRLSDRLLVQRVDDLLVIMDQSAGSEIVFSTTTRERLVETIALLFPADTPTPEAPAGHAITWTLNEGRILHPRVTCSAPLEADCHLDFTCECESIGEIGTDDQGRFHTVTVTGASSSGYWERQEKHRMIPTPGLCQITNWLENSDEVELDALDDVEITIPFEPVWAGDFYQWRPLVKSLP